MTSLTYTNLKSLLRVDQAQPGTYCSVSFISYHDIIGMSPFHPTLGSIYEIRLKAGKAFFQCQVPSPKRMYSEQQKTGDAGPYITHTVEAFFPFESKESRTLFNNMKYHRYVLLVYDYGDIVRIIGNKENPARFEHAFSTESSYRGSQGTSLRWTWDNPDKAPHMGPNFDGDGIDIGTGGGGGGSSPV